MAESSVKRPAEIFGFPIDNHSNFANEARRKYQCPFRKARCVKKSRLIDFPFGVCSVEYHGENRMICPHRFEQRALNSDVAQVLVDISTHYFGDTNNLVIFPEVRLPHVGTIDWVIVRHKPMQFKVEEFVAVEFQSDSTTGTGELVRGFSEYQNGLDLQTRSYNFGMNTYDSIKRALTQLMNKGIVYEAWNSKSYWVMQEYIYANLVTRYDLKRSGYSEQHSSVFALYDLVPKGDQLNLAPKRFVSTSVEDVYQSMRNNPSLPNKDHFVQQLNEKLRLKLSVK